MKSPDDNDRLRAGTLPANPFDGLDHVGEPESAEPELELPAHESWPKAPASDAYYGLAGEFVRIVEPHSEADPAALLTQLLVAFGSAVGRGPHYLVESTRHTVNEFLALVGVSSKARKGTSFDRVKGIFEHVDPTWTANRIASGLSSGEGLICQVRDPIEKQEPVKEKGRVTGYETVITDHGESDKRLLVVEAELATVLRVLQRDGNTLSPVLRCAWDSGDLRTLTKNSPTRATGAHVSIIGHITKDETLRYLDRTEMGNGFGNRFLWVAVQRSKCLPEGGKVDPAAFNRIVERTRVTLAAARDIQRLQWDTASRSHWREVYPQLSEGRPGLLGSMTARAEAHVLRLSCLYALLDQTPEIRLEHLSAALALWDYCARSAAFVFGRSLGDPLADRILAALDEAPGGVTRTEIRDLTDRNCSGERIGRALSLLESTKLAARESLKTDGRPREVWKRRGTT